MQFVCCHTTAQHASCEHLLQGRLQPPFLPCCHPLLLSLSFCLALLTPSTPHSPSLPSTLTLIHPHSALNWEPDEEGINGMVITKTLPSEAANVLEKGVRKMTPRIMTWTQYLQAALHYTQQLAAHLTAGRLCQAPAGPYQPDYTRCADHFLLHAGGYAILRGIQKGLR